MVKGKGGTRVGDQDDEAVGALLSVANGKEVVLPLFPMTPAELPELRREFEPLVQLALDDPAELYRREYSQRLGELARDHAVKIQPASVITTGRSRVVFLLEYRDLHVLLSWGLLLLMDEYRPYGRNLSRCLHCGRYYLARRHPKGGPANRSYCSKEHRARYHDSGLRKEASMSGPVAEHFLEIVTETFPERADLVRADQSGDLRMLVDWTKSAEGTRPPPIELRISREAISDYSNSNRQQRSTADAQLSKILKQWLANMEESATPVPRVRWVVSTHEINL